MNFDEPLKSAVAATKVDSLQQPPSLSRRPPFLKLPLRCVCHLQLKEDYKNMQSTHQQNSAVPSTPPASSGPPKGPPKVDAGTAKKLLKKRTKKTEL